MRFIDAVEPQLVPEFSVTGLSGIEVCDGLLRLTYAWCAPVDLLAPAAPAPAIARVRLVMPKRYERAAREFLAEALFDLERMRASH